jgi:hypothetical protein
LRAVRSEKCWKSCSFLSFHPKTFCTKLANSVFNKTTQWKYVFHVKQFSILHLPPLEHPYAFHYVNWLTVGLNLFNNGYSNVGIIKRWMKW